jgi:hypothetical protein
VNFRVNADAVKYAKEQANAHLKPFKVVLIGKDNLSMLWEATQALQADLIHEPHWPTMEVFYPEQGEHGTLECKQVDTLIKP